MINEMSPHKYLLCRILCGTSSISAQIETTEAPVAYLGN